MNLIATKCPNCGANIQLDDSKDKIFCMYCGCQIVVQDEIKKIQIVNNPTIENYIELAQRSFKNKLYDDAYTYYNKILELNPNNCEAIYNRGLCAAWKSSLANCRINEFISAFTDVLEIAGKDKLSVDSNQLKKKIAVDTYEITMQFAILVSKHYKDYVFIEDAIKDYWNNLIYCTKVLEIASTVITDTMCNESQETRDIKISINNSIIDLVHSICEKRKYQSGYSFGHPTYKTTYINESTRIPLMSSYNKAVQEIRKYKE